MDQPRYFHLLSEQEIDNLKPLLELLRDSRDTVLRGWYDRYADHFGASVTLPRAVFLDIFGRDIDALVKNLLDGEMAEFAVDMRALGQELLERGVPFEEIIASLHLFEESASACFASRLDLVPNGSALYGTFDKLSHCRMIVLAGTYFAGYRVQATARLDGLEAEASRLADGFEHRTRFYGLIGASAAMAQVYEKIAAAAGARGAVFVYGESGTGKELAARAVHEAGIGAARPFIAVNCAALPRELLESELFGHSKGAYTGAQTEYLGLIRAASGGTLFLDEITEMPVEAQAKLLRVLEEHAVRPVGSTRELPVDVRFIASTNRDPQSAVELGLLRKDLYYRLNVHRISMPALRERLDDVPLLVEHFTRLLGSTGLRNVDAVGEDAMRALQEHSWPGNVRELRSAVEYGLSVGQGARLQHSDLPPHVVTPTRVATAGTALEPLAEQAPVPTLDEAERALIVRALAATSGNKLRAARMLRISRHRLYDKLRKYGLEPSPSAPSSRH